MYLHKINENTKYAFNECKELKNVTISEGVEEIGYSAFAKTSLESIEIPASVNMIDNYVFFNCDNLKEVTFNSSNPEKYSNTLFYECKNFNKVFVPNGTIELYADWLSTCILNNIVYIYEYI